MLSRPHGSDSETRGACGAASALSPLLSETPRPSRVGKLIGEIPRHEGTEGSSILPSALSLLRQVLDRTTRDAREGDGGLPRLPLVL